MMSGEERKAEDMVVAEGAGSTAGAALPPTQLPPPLPSASEASPPETAPEDPGSRVVPPAQGHDDDFTFVSISDTEEHTQEVRCAGPRTRRLQMRKAYTCMPQGSQLLSVHAHVPSVPCARAKARPRRKTPFACLP